MKKLKEINKAMTTHFLREHNIVKVFSGDNLLTTDDKEVISALNAIRKRGSGVALLLIEKK